LGGVTPRLFLEDIYRAGECYLCDVADVLEKEVLRLCEEQQKRSQGALRGGGAARGAGGTSSSSSSSSSSSGGGGGGGGGGPTYSSLHAEVAAGADFVWQTMLQAYELVGDQFELYATRNVFLWPEGVEFSVRDLFRDAALFCACIMRAQLTHLTKSRFSFFCFRRALAAASCTRPRLRTPRTRA
jgi:hypothetical protein